MAKSLKVDKFEAYLRKQANAAVKRRDKAQEAYDLADSGWSDFGSGSISEEEALYNEATEYARALFVTLQKYLTLKGKK